MLRNPIPRIGFTDAVRLIRENGYRLLGRELISPPKEPTHVARYQFGNDIGGNAEYHVTTATAQRLHAELKKTPPAATKACAKKPARAPMKTPPTATTEPDSVDPYPAIAIGGSKRIRTHDIWRDHRGRLVFMKRLDRMPKRQLAGLVERLRNTLWMNQQEIEVDGETGLVEIPDIEQGGVGGAEAVDLITELLGQFGLNPTLTAPRKAAHTT
jgi:hypothetical protein